MFKTYLIACWEAIHAGWFEKLDHDCATGNCFQILYYGVKSSLLTLLILVVRIIFTILFPLTAFLVIKSDKERKKWEQQVQADL